MTGGACCAASPRARVCSPRRARKRRTLCAGRRAGDGDPAHRRAGSQGACQAAGRHRAQPADGRATGTPRDLARSQRALGYTLRQPRPATELPIKVATYTVRGSPDLRFKTVIAAESCCRRAGHGSGVGLRGVDKGRVIADAFDRGLPHGSSASPDGVMLVTAAACPRARIRCGSPPSITPAAAAASSIRLA